MNFDAEQAMIAEKVAAHLYRSAVKGTLNGLAALLEMGPSPLIKNKRYPDLATLYDLIGPAHRELFYRAACAITEFAVYSTIDFIDEYKSFPDIASNCKLTLKLHCNEEGKNTGADLSSIEGITFRGYFKQVAKSDKAKNIIDECISSIVARLPLR